MIPMSPNPEEPPLRCPECGKDLPPRALHTICLNCLSARHLKAMRVHEVEVHASTPLYRMELAHERRPGTRGGTPRHITFADDWSLGYCGAHPNESRKQRVRASLEEVLHKEHVCPHCLSVLQAMQERARGQQGVMP